MLGVHEWLPLTAALMFLLQASESAKIRLKWLAAFFCVAPIAIALSVDQFLVQYSILHVHEFVAQYGKLLAGMLLLEALLVAFGKLRTPIVTFSGLLGLLYLQMCFYQVGWLDWSFTMLALAFGIAASLLILAARLLAHHRTIVAQILCCWLFLVITGAYAAFPAASNTYTSSFLIELTAALKSMGVLLIMTGAGYLTFRISNHHNKTGVET